MSQPDEGTGSWEGCYPKKAAPPWGFCKREMEAVGWDPEPSGGTPRAAPSVPSRVPRLPLRSSIAIASILGSILPRFGRDSWFGRGIWLRGSSALLCRLSEGRNLAWRLRSPEATIGLQELGLVPSLRKRSSWAAAVQGDEVQQGPSQASRSSGIKWMPRKGWRS